ncbi:MAG: NAD(P)/FAD-dependent oxidoreductase [archaeon]|nr:NAD(P)/FAD-dependent oxidoreductase [archaeon]
MVYDVVIVGAGPAGLTAGMYSGTNMMSTLIIDAGFVGGQLTSLYPEKSVRNFPCFEGVRAKDLSDRLRQQAESMNCEIHENEVVEEIRDDREEFSVKTNVREYSTRSVIIATGTGIFNPKKMGCEGEISLNGKGLSYVMPSMEELVGKKVVIFGGGNSAIEMAMMANSITDTTIVHRRDEFRADERNVTDLMNSSVKIITSARLISINGTNCVESVTLDLGEKIVELSANLVVISIGTSSNDMNLKRWGLEFTENGLIRVKPDMSTSRRGIFACGDAVDYPGKCKKIIIGCGEACTAALSAHRFVRKPYWI